MVEISIEDTTLHINIKGWDVLFSLKSHLQVAVKNIKDARIDAEKARSWPEGLRLPGSFLPGVITAGSYYELGAGKWEFWDVHNPESSIVIELENEPYERLIIEVPNPQEAVSKIRAAMSIAH